MVAPITGVPRVIAARAYEPRQSLSDADTTMAESPQSAISSSPFTPVAMTTSSRRKPRRLPDTVSFGCSLVAALRSSAPVRRAVSSDDVADTASGVIATVLALTQQVGGTTGQYGVGPGADAAMPPITPAGG